MSPADSIHVVLYRGRASFFLALLSVACIATTYLWTLAELVQVWRDDPNYSHGFVVPLASLLIAVISLRRGGCQPLPRQIHTGQVLAGLTTIGFGFSLHLVAWFISNLLLDVVSLVIVLLGVLHGLGGRELRQRFVFPVLFLLFMAPLPITWYQAVAREMQQIVTIISAVCLRAMGVPINQQGYMIHLPGYSMQVGIACSGLRQLTAVLGMTVAIGYLNHCSNFFRWTLALLALPIAIAANCLRIVMAGVTLRWFGAAWAEGVYHTLHGVATMVLAGILVLCTARLLSKLEKNVGKIRTNMPPKWRARLGRVGSRLPAVSADHAEDHR